MPEALSGILELLEARPFFKNLWNPKQGCRGTVSTCFYLIVRAARLQNEVDTTYLFEAQIFSRKMLRNFPRTFLSLFLCPENPRNSRQISNEISLQKIKKNSPTSFCRRAGRIIALRGLEVLVWQCFEKAPCEPKVRLKWYGFKVLPLIALSARGGLFHIARGAQRTCLFSLNGGASSSLCCVSLSLRLFRWFSYFVLRDFAVGVAGTASLVFFSFFRLLLWGGRSRSRQERMRALLTPLYRTSPYLGWATQSCCDT